jgi:hypothetical protein
LNGFRRVADLEEQSNLRAALFNRLAKIIRKESIDELGVYRPVSARLAYQKKRVAK